MSEPGTKVFHDSKSLNSLTSSSVITERGLVFTTGRSGCHKDCCSSISSRQTSDRVRAIWAENYYFKSIVTSFVPTNISNGFCLSLLPKEKEAEFHFKKDYITRAFLPVLHTTLLQENDRLQ